MVIRINEFKFDEASNTCFRPLTRKIVGGREK